MKVFISSTSDDLKPYRLAAADVVRDAQWEPIGMEHFPADPRPIVQLCENEIEKCGLVILLQAWRFGWVPDTKEGGDGKTSITGIEIATADALPRPVLSFLADGKWPGELWDEDATARASTREFRARLNRTVKFFHWEDDPRLPAFRAVLREGVANYRIRGSGFQAPPAALPAVALRVVPPDTSLPSEPYPLLGPYEHPRTFAGRDAEITALAKLVAHPALVLCVHAASGAGKSSLLLAGLVPWLRSESYTVSIDRAPGDPRLGQRLLRDILEPSEAITLGDDDAELPATFARWVAQAYAISKRPIVFVLDQFDDVLRNADRRDQALARIGPLMSATAERLPGVQGFPCKWVLCYRHEFHGEVRAWLEDVLAHARNLKGKGLESLPSDLSDTQKSHDWAMPVMGKPSPDDHDRDGSRRAFFRAIAQPLELEERGRRLYRYVIPRDGAERLAAVFADLRRARPDAPLVPELQVMLNDLLRRARERVDTNADSPILVDVPEGDALAGQIHNALRDHVENALIRTFPEGREDATARLRRTRALLALRHLADVAGVRTAGLPHADLIGLIGRDGDEVLAKLAAADARLVVVNRNGRWELSHDLLAKAVTEVVADEASRGSLIVDQALLDLHRVVGQKASLYRDTTDESTLKLTRKQRDLIQTNEDIVVDTPDRRSWWRASRKAHDLRRRGTMFRSVLVVVAVFGLRAGGQQAYMLYQRNETYQRALVRGQMTDALTNRSQSYAALVDLIRGQGFAWSDNLSPFAIETLNAGDPEIFTRQPWTQAQFDAAGLLEVIGGSYPLFIPSRSWFGAITFALEEVFVRTPADSDVRARARSLSQEVRAAFITYHKSRTPYFLVPPSRLEDDPLNHWVRFAPGEFVMGADGITEDERPAHRTHISAPFSMQQHEVTNAEYRRFDPTHDVNAAGDLPVVNVSWYEGMAYAVWLGGSLPTEAQWEFAARGAQGRKYPWGDKPEPSCDLANYSGCSGRLLPVGTGREMGKTPEGLYDLAGNAWEWCRDWSGQYGSQEARDSLGPVIGDRRVLRGGSFDFNVYGLGGGFRFWNFSSLRYPTIGFRVVSSRLPN